MLKGYNISQLGFVASGRRSIRSGYDYDRYFDLSGVQGKEITLVEDGNVYDTISRMKKIVRETLNQTKRIAQKLQGSTREATARNVWNFLYHHIQYKIDNPKREQLRTPLRSWKDRKTGIDCDCYSIFISSVLTNLGIPHSFRIAAYKNDFQHVYVIVPKSGTDYTSYYTIDPVVDRFNYEVPPSNTKDFNMKTTMLNGFDLGKSCNPDKVRPIQYVSNDQLITNNLVSTAQVLKEAKVPHQVVVDENNNPVVVVATKQGDAKLPTVITAAQATELKTLATQSNTQAEPETKMASMETGTVGGIMAALFSVGGLCWYAFSDNKPALSGPPRSAQRTRSAKPARKKMKSLTL